VDGLDHAGVLPQQYVLLKYLPSDLILIKDESGRFGVLVDITVVFLLNTAHGIMGIGESLYLHF
jgi:hypothetical protein